MNFTTAVMLLNQNISAIHTIYEEETEQRRQPRTTFKTLDTTIQVGDFVVIPTDTRHKMTVVKVVGVDVDVDFESQTPVQWVISKVNMDAHNTILSEEQKWIETIKASEKRRKREELKKNMLEMFHEDGIEQLAIANMGSSEQEKEV